jgi:hypothetical protein
MAQGEGNSNHEQMPEVSPTGSSPEQVYQRTQHSSDCSVRCRVPSGAKPSRPLQQQCAGEHAKQKQQVCVIPAIPALVACGAHDHTVEAIQNFTRDQTGNADDTNEPDVERVQANQQNTCNCSLSDRSCCAKV